MSNFEDGLGHDLKMTNSDDLQRKYWSARIAEMPPEMVVRECIHHTFEAHAAGVVSDPEFRVGQVKVGGINRLCLMNNARGMTEDEILSFATELHWSSSVDKQDGGKDNKGFGIRAVSLRASPAGVIFVSARDGIIYQVKMWLNDKGEPKSTAPEQLSGVPAEVKSQLGGISPDNFFATILLGEAGRENTVAKPWPRGSSAAYYGIGLSRYWSYNGAKGQVVPALERAGNGPWLPALGDWLKAREAARAANPAASNVLKDDVIRFDDGDVEVIIFHAHKTEKGKPTSAYMVGAGEYTNGCGIIADGSAVPEIYSQTKGGTYSRLAGAFELGSVSDVVSVYVRLKGRDMHRVHSERRHVLWANGYEAERLDGSIEEIAKPSDRIGIRDFRYSILRAIKSPQAKWLRQLIEDRRRKRQTQEDLDAKLRMHKMAAQLDLLDKDGLILDDDGNVIVDPGTPKPQPQPQPGPGPGPGPNPPQPGPRPRPGPTPNPKGKRRAKNFGSVFREFNVISDDNLPKDVPFEWRGWETEGGQAELLYNVNFSLFEGMHDLVMKKYVVKGVVDIPQVEAFFEEAMAVAFKDVLSGWYVMTRWREHAGDLKGKMAAEREPVWVGSAATCLHCYFDLQKIVFTHVGKAADKAVKVAAQ